MKQIKKTVTATLLMLLIGSVAFGGTITGSRSGASAARVGTITGSRTGTITGSRTGTITGSKFGPSSTEPASLSRVREELMSQLALLLINLPW